MPARKNASSRGNAAYPYPYDAKAIGLAPIAYWPLDDETATAVDLSINANNGAYNGSTYELGHPGIGDGSRSVLLNPGVVGGADGVNIYSAGFNTLFDGNEGSVGIWSKAYDDTSLDAGYLVNLYSTEPNRFYFSRPGANAIRGLRKAGGVADFGGPTSQFDLDWVHWLFTWSEADDEQYIYKNGKQTNSFSTLGTHDDGALNSGLTRFGNYTSAAGFGGWLAKGIVFDRRVTAAEAMILGRL